MSKKSERKRLAALAEIGGLPAGQVAEVATTVPVMYVLGAKAPRHRVGHNSAAWAVITPLLPAATTALAGACGKVEGIGGPKGNGMLYVSYAIRRGWLAKQA